MKFTGERFVPEFFGTQIAIEHWHRYIFASSFCKNRIVLDIACGEGYGSYFISKVAKKVYGIDISEEAIEHAKSKYIKENLEFLVGNVANIPLPDKSIDIVVSFETIEHVPEVAQKKFLNEVKRILKRDGLFICSTPDKYYYSDLYNYKNEFHIKEFYKDEFLNFLKEFFANNILGVQHFYPSSIMDFKKDEFKIFGVDYINEEFIATEKEIDRFNYLISVSSDSNLNNLSVFSSANVDIGNKWVEELTDESKQLIMAQLFYGKEEQFNEKDSERQFIPSDKDIYTLKFSINSKDVKIFSLRFDPASRPVVCKINKVVLKNVKDTFDITDKIKSNALIIHDGTYYFSSFDPQIYFNVEADVINKYDSIEIELLYLYHGWEALNEIINQLESEINTKNSYISHLENEISKKNSHISELESEISKKNSHISELENEIIGYVTSKSWKITRPLRQAKRLIKRILGRH
jgi:ubiquinone/menaquinone biosynthesis C-methylase UbiE